MALLANRVSLDHRSTDFSIFSQLKWLFGGYHVFRLYVLTFYLMSICGRIKVQCIGWRRPWELAESRTTCLIFPLRKEFWLHAESLGQGLSLADFQRRVVRKPGRAPLDSIWTHRRCPFSLTLFGLRDGYPLFLTSGRTGAPNHWTGMGEN